MHSPTRSVLAVATLLLGATGCTSAAPNPSDPGTPPAAPLASPSSADTAHGIDSSALDVQRKTAGRFGPLPLDAYKPSRGEDDLLLRASRQLQSDCLAEFGFSDDRPQLPDQWDADIRDVVDAESQDRILGHHNVEQARTTGYLPAFVVFEEEVYGPGGLKGTSPPPSNPALEFVLYGERPGEDPGDQIESPGEVDGVEVPPNGCAGKANLALWGSYSTIKDDLANDLGVEAWFATAADPRMVEIERLWQQCMSGRGYAVGTLKEEDAKPRPWDDVPIAQRPTEDERAMAVADAECNNEVGYADAFYVYLTEHHNRLIEENQLALAEERAELDEALAHANDLLRTS